MILRPLFCFKDTKNTGLLIFNSLKQKKLIFNFVVNRNWKKLTDSRKRAKILTDNRKRYHPIETLVKTSTEKASFQNRSPEWRFLKEPFCCTSVNGMKTKRFLRRIPSRCWIPWPFNVHSPNRESLYFVFVWTFRNDWKKATYGRGFFKYGEKKSPFSN